MTIPYLHQSQTKLMLQVVKDLDRDEGFREFAYPDPLSSLHKKFPPTSTRRWGFVPAADILRSLNIDLAEAAKLGAPWTVGYGFTHGVTLHHQMKKNVAQRRLEQYVVGVDEDLRSTLSWYADASFVTKTVLINMYFNLGKAGLLSFKNTLRYIKEKNYKQASANMLKSLWARQVGQRAARLARRIETQEIPVTDKAPDRL